jgi:serine/threonine protein kinase
MSRRSSSGDRDDRDRTPLEAGYRLVRKAGRRRKRRSVRPPRERESAFPPRRQRDTSTGLWSGEVLDGKYRLLEPIRRGGMGSVWRARNLVLDVDVAIKIIRSDIEEQPGERLAERMQQEARAAARLGHPGIVKVHDFGATADGAPYIAMELLEGEDLATTFDRRGRIMARAAVRSLLPIAHALAVAHEAGVIHRDLKPENIYFARKDEGRVQPKLIDFGIAKLFSMELAMTTGLGVLVGTPSYMSPEHARGEPIDDRGDIWAFCVVLYEMMAGRRPFSGKNNLALIRAIIEHEPLPIGSDARVDEALWQILLKGLAKTRQQRWGSMRALGRALAQWLKDLGDTNDISGASLDAMWFGAETGGSFDSVMPPDSEERRITGRVLLPTPAASLPTVLDCYGLTDPGRDSNYNHDHYLIASFERRLHVQRSSLPLEREQAVPGEAEATVMLVADGIGADIASGVASAAAVDGVLAALRGFQPSIVTRGRERDDTVDGLRAMLVSALKHSDHRARQRGAGKGGAALTLAYLLWPRLYLAHVGHSRCYLMRDGAVKQLTRDHTVAERARESGEDVDPGSPLHHVVWNVLGGRETTEPEIVRTELCPGDALLLCSHGLVDQLQAADIAGLLRRADSAERACRSLIEAATEAGSTDNVTVVVARAVPGQWPR